jgi:drug/metabolite transporter (DMT)-like permease
MLSCPILMSELTHSSPHRTETRLALFALIAGSALWGLTWWPLKFFASLGLDGHSVSLTAYSVVALLSLPLLWRERRQCRQEWHYLLMIGLFFGTANVALTYALMAGSVVRVMLLFFLLPVWGILGGALFLKERIGWRRLIAVVFSLAGVFAILGAADALDTPLSLADVLALIAGLAYTAGGIGNRKAQTLPMLSRTLVSFVGCALIALLALVFSVPSIPTLSAIHWLWLVLFAAVWLMGATLLTTYGVTHVQASRAAVFQVVELLVAVTSAVLIGGESLSAHEYLGAALIMGAALLEAQSQTLDPGLRRDDV